MKNTLYLIVALVIVICAGCSRSTSGAQVLESRQILKGVSLARTDSGNLCVHSTRPRAYLCSLTQGAELVGWKDRFVGIRIGVPSKEFLLVDTQDDYIWVLSEHEFRTSPKAQGLRMAPLKEAWLHLGRHGA